VCPTGVVIGAGFRRETVEPPRLRVFFNLPVSLVFEPRLDPRNQTVELAAWKFFDGGFNFFNRAYLRILRCSDVCPRKVHERIIALRDTLFFISFVLL
jgi:hypothetical protein